MTLRSNAFVGIVVKPLVFFLLWCFAAATLCSCTPDLYYREPGRVGR
jgi:hypothetical protein